MNYIFKYFAAILVFIVASSNADDIDIYLNASPTGGEPYVHLMLDYRPSVFSSLCKYGTSCGVTPADGSACPGICFSQDSYDNLKVRPAGDDVTRFEAFIAVMETIFTNPLFGGINMALVSSNFDHGGVILEGYRKLGDTYSYNTNTATGVSMTGAEILVYDMKTIPIPTKNNEVHKLAPQHTYYEWMQYLNGDPVDLGVTGSSNNFLKDPNAPTYDAEIMNVGATQYDEPIKDINSCSKLFSIMIAMQTNNEDKDRDAQIQSQVGFSVKGTLAFVDMMAAMHADGTDLIKDSIVAGDQPLEKSWVISDATGVGQTKDWAAAGGSSLLLIDKPDVLEGDLLGAFKQILSVSATFVGASVPVNVFNRAEALDNLYTAVFEARESQRWPGNVKKLRLVDTDGDGTIDDIWDANDNPGFESTGDDKGRISFDALTYWTTTDSVSLPAPGTSDTDTPVGADGRVVDRGGAGQQIDGLFTGIIGDRNADSGARQVFVEPDPNDPGTINGTPTAYVAFDANEPTATALAAYLDPNNPTDVAAAKELIQWGRGMDVDNEEANGVTAPRSWILGDSIHSRPLAINYGATPTGSYTEANPNIRLFYGTNDGAFHIVQNTNPSTGTQSGDEIFTFYSRDALGNLKVRREETETSAKMRYGIDGEPVSLTINNNNDANLDGSSPELDKVYVYVGMRRGGYSYYAIDASLTTADPKQLWKITQTTGGGDFDELGLTFSTPVVGKVVYDGTAKDVLIFAGGYNGGWNADRTARIGKDLDAQDDPVGNAVYIVDAITGALIWKAVKGASTAKVSNTEYNHIDLVDSIPSDVTPIRNADGIINRLYVGDTGGAIWRVDLPVGTGTDWRKDNWFISKFAELGTDGTTTDRRFFHSPDVVETFEDSGEPFDGILINSGNRADPTETDVENYLYYLKDFNITAGSSAVRTRAPITHATPGFVDQTTCLTGVAGAAGETCSDPALGWRIKLDGAGEKALSTPLVDGGRVFFTSYGPTTATCEPSEGVGSVYVVNLRDGTAVFGNQRDYTLGPGIPSGAIALGDAVLLPGGGAAFEDTDGDGDLDLTKLPKSLAKKFFQIYWREPGIDSL